MKKKLLIIFILVSSLYSESTIVNRDLKEMQKDYMQFGYDKCIREVYPKAFEDAKQKYKKILENHKEEWRAFQAAKYATKNGNLTYAKMYRKYNPLTKGYEVVILPPKIKKRLTIEEISNLPEINIPEDNRTFDNFNKQKTSNNPIKSNSFITPSDTSGFQKISNSIVTYDSYVIRKFPKDKRLMDILEDMNIEYEEGPVKYTVKFRNKEQVYDLCYKYTGESQCIIK